MGMWYHLWKALHGREHCVCRLPPSTAVGAEPRRHLRPKRSACALWSLLLPLPNAFPLQHRGISLLGGLKPREGRNQHGSPKKVSGRETRPSHSGNSGSSPVLNHRPPCLFPSPRATSVCVCELTTRVIQTHLSAPQPDSLLVLALGTSQQCHQDLALLIG